MTPDGIVTGHGRYVMHSIVAQTLVRAWLANKVVGLLVICTLQKAAITGGQKSKIRDHNGNNEQQRGH